MSEVKKNNVFKRLVSLVSEGRVFDSYFKVDVGTIKENRSDGTDSIYNRFKVTRPDASAILIFNEDSKKVTLVKQFRYPISHREPENIPEVAAGKIDQGETPAQAALRELKEEVGYNITEDKLGKPFEMYASIGYSTEKIFIFLAMVKDSDKTSDGGGLATEHENIEIYDLDVNEFLRQVRDNEIKDAKTIIASMLIKQ